MILDTDTCFAPPSAKGGVNEAFNAEQGFVPADVHFSVKPYPWPSKIINFAAFITGGFFKLLVVFAFLPQVK